MPLKIIFAGTPEFAASSLSAIIEAGFDVVAVYTQPDRPAGRGKKLTPSPVKAVATQHNIAVEQPLNFKQTADLEQLQSYQADVMVVAAYGIILPKAVLDAFPLGCINIHASLLPRWRGAAPIQRAIAAGDQQTGITIMQMDVGLDTGDMLLKEAIAIQGQDTGSSLHDKLAACGAKLCVKALKQLPELQQSAQSQDDSQANYAHKLNKQEAQIDWTQSAQKIERLVRAFNSWPVAFTHIQDKVMKVWHVEVDETQSQGAAGTILAADGMGILVQCGCGSVRIIDAQLPNSKRMSVGAILNSKREWFEPGAQFE